MSIRGSRETLGTDRPAPGAADSVQRGDGVQPGPQPQGTRSCADPSPPVASLLQLPPLKERTLYPRISLPPARTSHWIPNRCQFGGGGVAWRQPGGFRTQGGRGRGGGGGCPSQATPPQPTPTVVPPKWGGPECAPPVGSGYLAIRRKTCRQRGRG